MRKLLSFAVCCWIAVTQLMATGAPSTYFNIYLPPNNDAVHRDVNLVVTAIYDGTTFTITDDNADGDQDDTVTGTLNAGQSYVLYIKDNGINDDAASASGGTLKRDGDYFIINSSQLVFASMSTDSDWQHDFVPSVNKTSLGERFIIYAPKISSSKRDLNVFAYQDSTTITISKISASPTVKTGYTNINLNNKTIVRQRIVNRGQDIINYFQDGRDVMETGETYMIETNKPVTVQYGALFGNERDGGGYAPSSNGSSSGELFYFAVPYQSAGEQEIRFVSWDNQNVVKLERYNNGTWVTMQTTILDRLKPGDWVGKRNGNASYPTVFRISCTPGKTISVFECNWMETGSPGTSDMASMVSSEDGTDSGKDFLVYLLPPGKQDNVVNPFTGTLFGGNYAHCYLYASKDAATVTIKDAKTNGTVINRTYTIAPHRYVDAYFSLDEWKSIYNGTGDPSTGPDRPYVLINSDKNISVMNANTNDNWMMYFGSSLAPAFNQSSSSSSSFGIPGDTITVTSVVKNGDQILNDPKPKVMIGSGLVPISSTLSQGSNAYEGEISSNQNESTITFHNVDDLAPNETVHIDTKVLMTPVMNNGNSIPDNTVLSVETSVSGEVEGQTHQTIAVTGIQDKSTNLSQLIFDACGSGDMVTALSDSWNNAWIDYNNDGFEDLFVTDRDATKPNQLYKNNGNGSFTRITNGPLVTLAEKTVSSAWGDYNNDGYPDVFIVNATGTKSRLYKNVNGTFTEVLNSGINEEPQYFHGAAWVDLDNDGFLDLIVTNFFETRFHHVYHNNGNGTFRQLSESIISLESNRSTAPVLADYNNDGLVDVFIPNGDNKPNSLFKNIGNGQFEKITSGPVVSSTANSVGALWGDYDNDGWMDLYVLNASKQPNELYHNLGNGSFEQVTNTVLDKDNGDTHSAVWMDSDNDGDIDLFVTDDEGLKFYFINNGDGSFEKKRDEVLLANFGHAMGAATADYDKNGGVDVFVSTHSGQKNKLFCNQRHDDNHFINIKLVSLSGNKSAIGSTVRIKVNGKWQMRQVLPVQGIGSQSSLRQHFGTGAATKVDSIEVRWPSGTIQKTGSVNADQFINIQEENANTVSGFAFDDANGNCAWDQGERKIESVQFTINPLGLQFASGVNGAFSHHLAAGNYHFDITPNNHWALNCNASINITGSNGQYIVNLPLSKLQNEYDVLVKTAFTALRRGFAGEAVLEVENEGSAVAHNVEVRMTCPSKIEIKNASHPWDTRSGQDYIWHIDSLEAGKCMMIHLRDSVLLSAVIGETHVVSSHISAPGTESNKGNNEYEEPEEIVGAIDPNDMLVSPKGEGKEGLIPRNQLLTYTIRFQNVGTYYASRIVLENQLPKGLDLATFHVDGVSHAGYRYSLSADGLLTVVFDNINLPDSSRSGPESQGLFRYTIRAKQDIGSGQRITNQAKVIFDYEDGVVTNTVWNTIKYTESQPEGYLVVYPNPAVHEISIVAGQDDPLQKATPLLTSIRILQIDGTLVKEFSNTDNDLILHTTTDQLAPGVYIVEGIDASGRGYQGKVTKI